MGSTQSTVVVTRLEPRGRSGLRSVLRTTGEVVADCRSVPGFLGGRVAVDRRGRAWTLTVWDGPASLRAFGVRHAAVAARIDDVARDSAVCAFRQAGTAVPAWTVAAGRTPVGGPGRFRLHRDLAPLAGAPV